MNRYYFTFGFGQTWQGYYVIINALRMEEARQKMFDRYGSQWSFEYTENEWERFDMKKWKYKLLEEMS